jgi:amidophosphoribosyltransferase
VALGLHALQHRGQEAAGIVAHSSTDGFTSARRFGYVRDSFTSASLMETLPGPLSIGHVRYSTAGSKGNTQIRDVQPLFAELAMGGCAVAHNGNLTNALSLREELIQHGSIFQSGSDTECIIHLMARSMQKTIPERLKDALRVVEGAFSIVAMTRSKLIGVRDPLGVRPLMLGRVGPDMSGGWVLASETCALDIIGAEFVREVENGEVVVITREGIESHRFVPKFPARLCIFEYIYFSRPDSIVGGRSVYDVRKEMGRQLAREAPANADIVVPIPDSGVPAAIGYAQESGIPFEFGIIRNHYVGRTFIEPEQRIRQLGVKLKHSANEGEVKGKSIVLIDDSVVRGTTSVKIVQMMREAGAREVHMRISSPPITHPDFYGIDTPDQEKLLAATKTLEEMREFIGADSLEFLSVHGIYRAMGYEGRDDAHPQFTDHCFTGEYPTRLRDREGPPAQKQLSFLAEVG